MSYAYFTPAIARIAVEQIEAWYTRENDKKKIPEVIKTGVMDAPPLEYILKRANIDIGDLVKAGLASMAKETQYDCGMTGYTREDRHYEINMSKLRAYADGVQTSPRPPRPRIPGLL